MTLDVDAAIEVAGVGRPVLASSGIWLSDPSLAQRGCGFASLFDLARLQFGSSQVEICAACNTVNLGSAHQCKACAHKLPAYYAACEEQEPRLPRLEESTLPMRQKWHLADHASFNDFAAFALVVNLVVMVAEFMPIQ